MQESKLNQSIMSHLRPHFEAIYNKLAVLKANLDDPLVNRVIIFNIDGVDNPDFKLTGAMHNGGAIGEAGESDILFSISGPYGSRIDADLVFVSYDIPHARVVVATNGVNSYTIPIKLGLFMEEIKGVVLALSAFPTNSLVLPKLPA